MSEPILVGPVDAAAVRACLERVLAHGGQRAVYADAFLRALAGELTQAETVACMRAYEQAFIEPQRMLAAVISAVSPIFALIGTADAGRQT